MSDVLVTQTQLGMSAEYAKAYDDTVFMPMSGGTFTGGVFGNTVEVESNGVIDVAEGSIFTLNLDADITLSFENAPRESAVCFALVVKSSGQYVITWPSNLEWAGKSAPTFRASDMAMVISFISSDGGSGWYGTVSVSEDTTSSITALTDAEVDAAWDAAQ